MNATRPASVGLAVGALCAAAMAVVAAVITGNPLAGLVAFVVLAGIAVGVKIATVRGLIIAGAMLAISPGVFGETSLRLSLVMLLVMWALAMTYPVDRHANSTDRILTLAAFAALAIALTLSDQPPVALAAAAGGAVAFTTLNRRAFAVAMVRGLAVIFVPLAASYLVTMVVGWVGITSFAIRTRTLELYFPFTLATGGPPIIPNTRRFAPLVGEPGLFVFFLIPMFAMALTARLSLTKRALMVFGLAGMVAFTQSLATYVAFGAGLFAYALGSLAFRHRHPIFAIVIGAVAAWVAVPILRDALVQKSLDAAQSVTDRGVADAGGASAASLGDINLLVTYGHNQGLAIGLTAALILIGVVAFRSGITAIACYAMFFATALVAQPSQWQIGAWVMIIAATVLSATRPDGDSSGTPAVQQRSPALR